MDGGDRVVPGCAVRPVAVVTARADRTTRTAGALFVVGALLLSGCTGNARPPVVTRSADAPPVPRPAPEQTRVPLWTPPPGEVRAAAVRDLGLRWADGSEVVPEVVEHDDIVPAVDGEHFTRMLDAFPESVWPFGAMADGTIVVRDDTYVSGDGFQQALGLMEVGSDQEFRPFDMSGVEPRPDDQAGLSTGMVAVGERGAAWSETYWSEDGSSGDWRVLTADEAGRVSVVAEVGEDWTSVHEDAASGDEARWADPAPVVVDDRVFFVIALESDGTGPPSAIVSRDLSGGDTRLEGAGMGAPVATTDAVFTLDYRGGAGTRVVRVGGDPVLELPVDLEGDGMNLDGAVGPWLLLSSQEAVVAVHPDERRAVAVGRAIVQNTEDYWAGPAMGGSRLAAWADGAVTEGGTAYLVMDPEAGTVWRLPGLLHGVWLNSGDILGWAEATSFAPAMSYARWTG